LYKLLYSVINCFLIHKKNIWILESRYAIFLIVKYLGTKEQKQLIIIFLKTSIHWKFIITKHIIKKFCGIDNNALSNTLKATVNVSHRIAGFDTINGYETANNIVIGCRQLSPAGAYVYQDLDSHLAIGATGT